MSVKSQIYLEAKRLAWAPSTMRSEARRLTKYCYLVEGGFDAEAIYKELVAADLAPYSIKTLMIRLSDFQTWLGLPATIKKFMETNTRLFKFAYETERLQITYEAAKRLILRIREPEMQTAALIMLEGGLRSCELKTLKGGWVTGKGGKRREVYLRPEFMQFEFKSTYAALYRALRQVGLKPHTLRKLCATRLWEQPGANDMDLMEVFGWATIDTSKRYRQPKRSTELAKLVSGARSVGRE